MGDALTVGVGEMGLFRMMMRKVGVFGMVRGLPQFNDVFAALRVWSLMALGG